MNFIRAIFNRTLILNILIGISLGIGLVFGLRSYLTKFTHHGEQIEIPDISKLNLFDALPVIQNAGLKYEIDSFKFDDKYPPYTIFDVYPSIGSEVKKGRRIFIRANPKTYAPVTIPNVKDWSKNNAIKTIERSGLIVGDTIYEPNKFSGIVLRMMYNNRVVNGGEEVPRFSKIDLVIGSSLDRDVPMVNVVGMSLEDAQHVLEQNYFEVGRIDDRDVLNKESENIRVFYQSPGSGELFDQGETVILFLTDQGEEEIQGRIAELNGIYRKTIKTDSLGGLNYNVTRNLSRNVSEETRRQVRESGIDRSTSSGQEKPKKVENQKPQRGLPEGVELEE